MFLVAEKLHREVDISVHHLVTGYITGYLVIVTGHHPEIFLSMRKDDVSGATLNENGHVVLVSYKTYVIGDLILIITYFYIHF